MHLRRRTRYLPRHRVQPKRLQQHLQQGHHRQSGTQLQHHRQQCHLLWIIHFTLCNVWRRLYLSVEHGGNHPVYFGQCCRNLYGDCNQKRMFEYLQQNSNSQPAAQLQHHRQQHGVRRSVDTTLCAVGQRFQLPVEYRRYNTLHHGQLWRHIYGNCN